MEPRTCVVCGSTFRRWPSDLRRTPNAGKYCSRECKHVGQRSSNAGRRGPLVRKHSDGYLLEWMPGHPRAIERGRRVLQHILVAEAVLGRALRPDEEVHHRNGRRDDNWPENLVVLSKSDHAKLHAVSPEARERMRRRGQRTMANLERDPSTGRIKPTRARRSSLSQSTTYGGTP